MNPARPNRCPRPDPAFPVGSPDSPRAPGGHGNRRLGRRAHTGYMGRIIGTVLSAIFAIWLAITIAGEIAATLKTFSSAG